MRNRILAVFLTLTMANFSLVNLLFGSQEGVQDKVQDNLIRSLIEKSYGDLFRSINEDFRVNLTNIQNVHNDLKEEEETKLEVFRVKERDLQGQQDAIRSERKRLNESISRDSVKLERLEIKLEKSRNDRQDLTLLEQERAQLEDSITSSYAKSESLKKQIDGNLSFDFEAAEDNLEELNQLLVQEKSFGHNTLDTQKRIDTLKIQVETAKGLKRKFEDCKKERLLTEVRYSHLYSKLDTLRNWPAKLKGINDTIVAGKQGERKFGDVENIGDKTKRDISKGKVLKILPLLIPKNQEVEIGKSLAKDFQAEFKFHTDERITEPIHRLGQQLALRSDAWCTFNFYIIADPPVQREINAFALPGGQVFIHDSLVLEMNSWGELAAVLAHEISHVNARHAIKRLSKMQWAQYASFSLIFLGNIGYWIYQGLGFGLNLTVLGITRASESEADILGTQILWNAGYDPRLLIDSFDHLLKNKKLGVSSFFRTHPSLDDRMQRVEEEVRYLPPIQNYVVGASDFQEVKSLIKQQRKIIARAYKEDKEKTPTLKKKGNEGSSEPSTPQPPVLKRKESTDQDKNSSPERLSGTKLSLRFR